MEEGKYIIDLAATLKQNVKDIKEIRDPNKNWSKKNIKSSINNIFMSKKINQILNQVLSKVEPPKEDMEIIDNSLTEFKKNISKEIKRLKIDADLFEGGSFAKKTIIKKDVYDVDIFIRFNEKYKNQDISKLAGKLLKKSKNVILTHGSRDYFKIKISPDFFIELVPVIKVNKPENADNITDLSFSHVRYINKKLKSKKTLNEIKIAKAFCYATNTYGAESYINGFSGYAIELLIYYYGSFLKFVKAMAKHKKEKIIIDIEKDYKRKDILLDMNSSKLESPIILVDPTFKQRNALAALSEETFERFKKDCGKFLKSPSIKSFEIKKVDLEKIEKDAVKNKNEFILLEAKTSKQEGDVAGSKLLKFYNHLEKEILKYFEIKNKGFNYNHQKSARYFFVVKKKSERLIEGPYVNDKRSVKLFKKHHKKTFSKNKRIYTKEKINLSIKEFIQRWKTKYKTKVKEMFIVDLKLVWLS